MASKKIEFSKSNNRFSSNCLSQLIALAIPSERGIYKPPLQKEEELVSNLLQVHSYPKVLFVGNTRFRTRKELNGWLNEMKIHGRREWILKNERIISFHNLTEYPWSEISDRGTIEDFESREL